MPIPLIPMAVASLVAVAYHQSGKHRSLKGKVTPERAILFETALREVKDPEALKKFADVFRKEGLDHHADLLLKRAKLRELPPDIKQKRRDAFRKGMASTDANAVRALADVFDKEGATGAATSLREYAVSLDKAPAPKPAEKTSEQKAV